MNKLIAKTQMATTAQLKEMALALMADLSAEASMVLDAVLSVLEGRIAEDEFVSFCEELEAA